MMIAQHIRTSRLVLRPLLLRDLRFFVHLIGNDETRKYLGGTVRGWPAVQRFQSYLAASPDSPSRVVCVGQAETAIGLVELGPHKNGSDTEISYQFMPDHWRNGYATEAVGTLLSAGLSDPDTDRIIAETQSANIASRRLLERLGLIECNRVRRFGAEQIIYATAS